MFLNIRVNLPADELEENQRPGEEGAGERGRRKGVGREEEGVKGGSERSTQRGSEENGCLTSVEQAYKVVFWKKKRKLGRKQRQRSRVES